MASGDLLSRLREAVEGKDDLDTIQIHVAEAKALADRLDDGVLLDRDARMAVSRVATMVECPECGCVELTQCSGGELDIGHGIHIARLERVKRQFEALRESGGGE